MTTDEHVPDARAAAPDAVTRQERRLLGELAAGATVSALAGTAAWLAGRRSAPSARSGAPGRSDLAAFGRQTLAWAAVDAAIAGWGFRGTRRSAPADPDTTRTRARRLRTVTLVNAVLDVGYVAGGVALARRPGRRGDGLAIVVQGLFLLWLDARHTRANTALIMQSGRDHAPNRVHDHDRIA